MFMILGSYSLVTLMAMITVTFLLMYAPAIIELKKPKDSGSRLIHDNIAKMRMSTIAFPIQNIEEEQNFNDQSAISIASFFFLIPNLEV
jgi:hypothetical protein